MILRLGLAPALTLQKRLSRAAFFTGLMIYLEGLTVYVLLPDRSLSPGVIVPVALVMTAQFVLVRRPVRLFVRDRLVPSYGYFLLLDVVFIALLWLGSRTAEDQFVATFLGATAVAVTSWPTIAAMRAARSHGSQLRFVDDPSVLLSCLSFDARQTIAVRLRSFGGDRLRWAAPYLIAILAMVASIVALALLMKTIGFSVGGFIGQISAMIAIRAFYRSMRHAKLRASELRERDTRGPVLILREFNDDTLTARDLKSGSVEHLFARELDRIGPTISIGRPNETLAPLGASRDYLADADWKRAVCRLIEDAAVVVFLLGDSESLLWEFRTTVATRGKRRTLMIVPPLKDRAELARRWARFILASEDLIGTALPRELPDEPILAVCFAGDDAVLMVGHDRDRSRSLSPPAALDYRLALRLFGCLLHEAPTSAAEVEAFVRRKLPVVTLSVPAGSCCSSRRPR